MFSPAELKLRLQMRLALPAEATIWIAFSGGLDSTVLLHAMAQLAAERHSYRLRAVHVDHGLHADSSGWSEHCRRQARSLQIELSSVRVDVTDIDELGLEAAARSARYHALRHIVGTGEYLFSAHHADDQLETMLLALMRGAGLAGLSAMPAIQPFGDAWLVRPLLDFTRAELEAWARAQHLAWLSDPSNDDLGLDRNLLRQKILAPLKQRWPAAAKTASRSAEHLQAAGRALEQLAALDAEGAIIGPCLDVARLRRLDGERRRNLLRYWIRGRGARAPSTRKLSAIEHDMLAAAEDRVPCMGWDDWEIRRHGNRLYCERRLPAFDPEQSLQWRAGTTLTLPAQMGRLRLAPTTAAGLDAARLTEPLTVRFRSGGESLQVAGEGFHRKLKQLLQASAILPWWRARVPLIYSGEMLVAVGDLWIEAEFAARAGQPACTIVWEDRPHIEREPLPASVRHLRE